MFLLPNLLCGRSSTLSTARLLHKKRADTPVLAKPFVSILDYHEFLDSHQPLGDTEIDRFRNSESASSSDYLKFRKHLKNKINSPSFVWNTPGNQQLAQSLFESNISGQTLIGIHNFNRVRMTTKPGVLKAVAICGHSNVGKSTLINNVLYGKQFRELQQKKSHILRSILYQPRESDPSEKTHHKKKFLHFAPVSDKPGQTRHIFRFDIGDKLRVVDLPGYGFAKIDAGIRDKWVSMMEAYLQESILQGQLQRCISLIDANRGVRGLDIALWEMFQEKRIPFQVVVTKIDLMKSTHSLHDVVESVFYQIEQVDQDLVWPFLHCVSALNDTGMKELRTSISSILTDVG